MINAENVKEAISIFSITVYKSIVPSDSDEIEMISKLEAGFERLIYRRAVTSYAKMFSYSTMIRQSNSNQLKSETSEQSLSV